MNITRHLGKHYTTHDMNLGFAFTDYRIQGLTVEALIIMLNKQSAVHDIPTIYVGFSRLQRLDDVLIWPLNLYNVSDIEHLVKLDHHPVIKLWKKGYDNDGNWDSRRLYCCVCV